MLKAMLKGVTILTGLILIIVGVAALAVGLQANRVARAGTERLLEFVLLTDVEIDEASVWIPAQTLILSNVRIMNPEDFPSEVALRVGTLTVELDPRTVLSDAPHVKTLVMDDVALYLRHELLRGTNMKQLMTNAERFDRNLPGVDAALRHFVVDRLECTGGRLHITSDILSASGLEMNISPFHIEDFGGDKPVDAAGASALVLKNLVANAFNSKTITNAVSEQLMSLNLE